MSTKNTLAKQSRLQIEFVQRGSRKCCLFDHIWWFDWTIVSGSSFILYAEEALIRCTAFKSSFETRSRWCIIIKLTTSFTTRKILFNHSTQSLIYIYSALLLAWVQSKSMLRQRLNAIYRNLINTRQLRRPMLSVFLLIVFTLVIAAFIVYANFGNGDGPNGTSGGREREGKGRGKRCMSFNCFDFNLFHLMHHAPNRRCAASSCISWYIQKMIFNSVPFHQHHTNTKSFSVCVCSWSWIPIDFNTNTKASSFYRRGP